MKVYSREISPWIIWLSLLAVLLACIGIFFFYTFLRQDTAELIDVVPTDATFVIEVNDHGNFEKGSKTMQPIFNELFVMDAFPAFDDIYHSLPSGTYPSTLSAHSSKESLHLLYNIQIDKLSFRKLLKKLNIDPNNNIRFENHKIYSYGTSFKSLKFVYFNHILSVSDDLEVLKKALIQLRHPKNLLSEKEFKTLYTLSLKNQKQCWVLLRNKSYIDYLSKYFEPNELNTLRKIETLSEWSAFQLRNTQNEMFLSGYIASKNTPLLKPKFEIPETVIPPQITKYIKTEGENYATTYFTIHEEDTDRAYLVLSEDTIRPAFTKMTFEELDAFKSIYPDGLYPVDSLLGNMRQVFAPSFFALEQPNWSFCMLRDGYYILSSSKENLQAVAKWYQSGSSIRNNNLYKFAKNSQPSKNAEEYTLLNNEHNPYWQNVLSKKGKESYIGKHLSVFSLYCTEALTQDSDNLTAINLYFLFNR